jgi:hypothetical protein
MLLRTAIACNVFIVGISFDSRLGQLAAKWEAVCLSSDLGKFLAVGIA